MLTGRGVLITGATRGLGRAIAERCLAEGADVAFCGRQQATVEEAAAALRAAHPDRTVVGYVADVRDAAAVARLVAAADEALDDLAGLVCNAGGYGPIGPLEACEPGDWADAVATNLFGTVWACRAVLPALRRRGGGRIVTISGGGASTPLPRSSAYAAAKVGVVRFTETLAVELEGSGIEVNAVAPGALDTAMLDDLLAAGPELAGAERFAAGQALRAQGGASPSEAAALVAMLLSNEATGISGRLISAVWDDWRALPTQREALAGSDAMTLRRVPPPEPEPAP